MAIVGNANPYMEKLAAIGNKIGLNDEQFTAASVTAEHELKHNPSLYKFKVGALAFVGYAFIGVIISLVGLALWGSWSLVISSHMRVYSWKLLLVLGLLLWALLKSLWIKMPPPEGIEVKRSDAPELFKMIDELSQALHTKVDKVLINGEYNASVVQVPMLGFLGLFRNYMNLGLPLMLIHSADEFKAVVAHELGHLSGNHSKSSAWIYNLRKRWSNLLINSQDNPFFTVFYLFLSWFSPRFDAYSLAMARAHELEADADAVKITGPHAFSMGMMRLESAGGLIERKFWKKMNDLINHESNPPENSYERYRNEVNSSLPEKEVLQKALMQAFKQEARAESTHPSLKQRLLHGHFDAVVSLDEKSCPDDKLIEKLLKPVDTTESAGAVYLGQWFDQALKLQSAVWAHQAADIWHLEHNYRKSANDRLTELDQLMEKQSLTAGELKEKAHLLLVLDQESSTLPIYEQLFEMDPDDIISQYNMGIVLLNSDNDRGIDVIKSAMSKRLHLAGDGCPFAISYLKKQNRDAEAKHFEDLYKDYEEEAHKARKERIDVDGKSQLEVNQLTEEEREHLQEVFRQFDKISYVYIVRKKVEYFQYLPFMAVGIEMNTSVFSGHEAEDKLELATWMKHNLGLPHEFCVITFELGSKALKDNMKAVPGSLVYSTYKK